MTWVKLPDDALDPTVVDIDDAAIVAYLRALGWSNRWLGMDSSLSGQPARPPRIDAGGDRRVAQVHRIVRNRREKRMTVA